jgi:hypothetical protein
VSSPKGFGQGVDWFLKPAELPERDKLLMPHFDQQVFHPGQTAVNRPDDGSDNRRDRGTGLRDGHDGISSFRHERKVCTRADTLTALAIGDAATRKGTCHPPAADLCTSRSRAKAAGLTPNASSPQGFGQGIDLFLKLVDLPELDVLLPPHFEQQVLHAGKTLVHGPDDGGNDRRNRPTGLLHGHD